MDRWWTSSTHLKITCLYSMQSISNLACRAGAGTQIYGLHSTRCIFLTDIYLIFFQKAVRDKVAWVRLKPAKGRKRNPVHDSVHHAAGSASLGTVNCPPRGINSPVIPTTTAASKSSL